MSITVVISARQAGHTASIFDTHIAL